MDNETIDYGEVFDGDSTADTETSGVDTGDTTDEEAFSATQDAQPQTSETEQHEPFSVKARAALSQAEEVARIRVDEQLREIAALDPSIRELRDLTKMESYPRLYELVKKGYRLADAFRLANFDSLRASTAEAARQEMRNAAAGKRHFMKTASRGAGAVTVPSEIREAYRAFNPDATEAEIQKHYNNYCKK